MAKRSQSNGSKSSRSRKANSSSKGRSKQEFDDYTIVDPADIPEGPDVLVDVPVVKVDKIDFELDDLRAQVAVLAKVQDIVQLSVGVEAHLGKVELTIEGVEAQALLKARLDNVGAILGRVATTLDRNPKLLESVGHAAEDVGGGAGKALDRTGDAVEEVGQGAEGAVQDVGQGAGQAAGQIGQGASQGLAGIGQGAQQGVAGLGKGAGQGLQGVGQGVQQLTGGQGQ